VQDIKAGAVGPDHQAPGINYGLESRCMADASWFKVA